MGGDVERFHGLMSKVNKLGGVTQEDFDKVVTEALTQDPKGVDAFLKQHAGVDEKTGQGPGWTQKGRQFIYAYLYLQFRITGLGYGPRFRCQIPYGTNTGEWSGGEWSHMGTVRLQDDCEDWEHTLTMHPGIIDSACAHVRVHLWLLVRRQSLVW